MTLWGNKDYATGNNKPKFANTSNLTSNSTIHGTAANTAKYYGNMFGVSATEQAASAEGRKVVHPGWVSQKIGTGPIAKVTWSGGTGYNSGGYIVLTDGSVYGKGTVATNISFTIANSENTLQSFSTNPEWNVINSITVVNGGSGWTNAAAISYNYGGLADDVPMSNATFTFTLGGRGGRTNYETIVAMGSITGDDPKDNSTFSGI